MFIFWDINCFQKKAYGIEQPLAIVYDNADVYDPQWKRMILTDPIPKQHPPEGGRYQTSKAVHILPQ